MRKLISDVAGLVRDLNTLNSEFKTGSWSFSLGPEFEGNRKYLEFELWNSHFYNWQELKSLFEELGYEITEFESVKTSYSKGVRIKIYDHT